MAATKIPQELLEKTSITFADNEKLNFGTGDDLQIFHDGSNSYIQSATGNLNITTAGGNEFALTAVNDGAVTLYHNGSVRIATTSTGIDVTGTVTADHTGGTGIRIETDGDTDANFLHFKTSSSTGQGYIGTESSTAGANFTGTTAYAFVAGSVSSGTDTQFLSAGAVRATIDHTGKVGIGTDAPETGLHLKGTSNVASGFTIEQVYSGSSKKFGFQPVYNDDRLDIWYNSNATSAITIKDGGNVGIGTTNPTTKLHVAGIVQVVESSETAFYAGNYVRVFGSSQEYGFRNSGGTTKANISMSGNSYFNGGNVAIGTTAPTSHINTGTFFKPDSNGRFLTLNGGANGSFIMLESQTTTDNDQIGGIYWNRTGAQGDAHKQVAGIDVIQDTYAPNNVLEGGTLRFFTKTSGSGTNTPRMVIAGGGNVGIGDSAPQDFLEVKSTSLGGITISNSNHNQAALSFARSSTATARIFTTEPAALHTSALHFQTSTAASGPTLVTAMTIDQSQNVGIGSSNPTSNLGWNRFLEIAGGSSNAVIIDGTDGQQANVGSIDGMYIDVYGHSTATNNNIIFRTQNANGVSSGIERMRIDSGGNVGIGTSSPYGKLQVEGNTNSWATAPMLVFSSSSTANAAVRDWAIGPADTNYGYFHINQGASTGASPLATSNVRFTISDTGNVGIGTTSPNAYSSQTTLTINGATYGRLDIESSNTLRASLFATAGSATLHTSQDVLSFDTSGGEAMRIDASGNVGIGITDPDQALEIGAGGKLKLSRADNSRSMLLYTNNADCVVQSDTDPLHLQSANRMTFATNGASERMRIATDGKIGIGTAAPEKNLSIGSSQAEGIQFNYDTTNNYRNQILNYWNSNADSRMDFNIGRASGATPSTIMSVGYNSNVGIGTTAPGSKLDIEGGSGGVSVRVKGDQPTGAYYYGYMYDGTNLKGTTQTNIFHSGSTIAASTTIAEYAGLRIDAPNVSASGAVVTNNYAIYSSGTAQKSYFAGKIGIGTTAPIAPLNIQSDSGANAIRIAARSGNDHGFISFYANDNTTVWSEISGSAGSLRFYTGASNVKMTIEPDGDVGIGLTDTQGSRLGVAGSLRLSGGSADLASVTTGTGSVVGSGSITHTIGYAGTYVSGKKWTWTYAATTWKSFHVTLRVSGTAGFSTYEGGGYNNNGGPMDTVEHGNDLGSFEVTRNGQNMIMTYTISTQTIHPFFELTYRQSGGDGSPYMSKLSLVQS